MLEILLPILVLPVQLLVKNVQEVKLLAHPVYQVTTSLDQLVLQIALLVIMQAFLQTLV